MKKYISLLLAAILLMIMPGCNAAPAKEAGNIRVVLDWTPNTNHTGLYAALENGYFEEEGLSVEIMQPPEDGGMVLLAAGNAEFAVDFQESMGPAIARDDALPVVAVAAIISHNTSGVMSLAEIGIESPKDLEGKRYATWGSPLVDSVIRSIVEGDGGDFGKVNMIPNAATDAISALQTDIDAIWIYYAWDGIAAQLQGLDINYLDFGTINPVLDFYTPVLVTNRNYAAQNEAEVKRFMKAVSRGYEFCVTNPEDAAAILLKHAPELDAELVRESQKYLAEQYRADALRWGEIDPARWKAFYDWMYAEGLLEKEIGGEGFTNQYLP